MKIKSTPRRIKTRSKRPEPEQIRTESQTFVVTDLNNIDTKTEQDDKAFIPLRQVTSSRRVTIKRELLDQESKDLLSGSVEAERDTHATRPPTSLLAQYTPNRDLPPIIDERTLYCNICRKTYKSIPIYRTHMKRIHKMGKKPIKRKPGDHSCNICGRLFASKLVRTSHCKIAHYGFRFNPTVQAHAGTTTPDLYDKSNRCSACKCLGLDVDGATGIFDPHANNTLTAIDKNCYCSVCNTNFNGTGEYYRHLLCHYCPRAVTRLYDDHYSGVVTNDQCKYAICEISAIKSGAVVLSKDDPHAKSLPVLDNEDNKCTVCEITFGSKNNFIIHLLTKYGSKAFTGMNEKDPHLNTAPDINDPNKQCLGCKKIFDTRNSYFAHLRHIYGYCIIPDSLNLHLNTVPNFDDKSYQCIGCGKNFWNTTRFHKHLKSSYKDISKKAEIVKFECNRCNTQFGSYNLHRFHLRYSPCAASTNRSNQHNNTVPNVRDKNLQCIGCKKKFDSKFHYYHHLTENYNLDSTIGVKTRSRSRVSKTSEDVPIKLEEDSKAFIPLRQVTSSRRVTIKREPLDQDSKDLLSDLDEENSGDNTECNLCRLTFVNLEQLAMHMEPCHDVNDLKTPSPLGRLNLKCHSCQIKFTGRRDYSRHLRITHLLTSQVPAQYKSNRDLPPIIDERTLYCNICHKTYKSIPIYRGHMKRIHKINEHSRERKPGNYSCNICGRLFSSKIIWAHHCIREHYGPKLSPTVQAHAGITTPDFHDKNNRCSACEVSFHNTQSYQDHLIFIYGSNRLGLDVDNAPGIFDPHIDNVVTAIDINCYCSGCKTKFHSTEAYYHHLCYHYCRRVINKLFNELQSFADPFEDTDTICECAVCKISAIKSGTPFLSKDDPHAKSFPDLDNEDNKCTVCKFTFRTKTNYVRHLLAKYGSKVFTGMNEKDPHLNTVPVINDTNKQCIGCKKIFDTRNSYFAHLRHIYGNHILPASFDFHLNTVPNLNDKSYQCIGCGMKFMGKARFHDHLERNYNDLKNNYNVLESSDKDISKKAEIVKFECDRCSTQFGSYNLHRFHLRYSPCAASINRYNQHTNTVPNVRDKNRQCIGCKKTFHELSDYHRHLTRNYNLDTTRGPDDPHLNTMPDLHSKNRKCFACKMVYNEDWRFWMHLVNKYNLKPKCENTNDDPHVNVVRNEDDEKNYCAACDRIFIYRDSYLHHINQLHGS
ncbi:uncharacterized protein EV154DRAFT_607202 [Mucor mucedo]|uniref:uncharacterized protein n=1 Tax=Mucor mucedo TaxID=29922 RepID=UPI002220CA35|nr:uncharacterized protein EV154DRAFT_607202 [Mucor mucedo]KAI7873333.1 hypothetical protein EV154DRAFT_607202 [Mucor mucedo]